MIIFGAKPKYKTISSGEFFCPSCQKTRRYERKGGKNYFSLYFIPVFPMGDLDEFIECQTCGRSYHPDVLKQKLSKPAPDVARLLNMVRTRLENGYPVEYMVRDLTDDGLDRDIALNVVEMAIGSERKICPKCDLTYASSILACADCDQTLRVK
ncbi:MAG: zinc ribbon domain-containing protein [Anaerolineae bacterium]|nr:zinc ribbon domain-containing protein [Anaerolineae bacterium]